MTPFFIYRVKSLVVSPGGTMPEYSEMKKVRRESLGTQFESQTTPLPDVPQGGARVKVSDSFYFNFSIVLKDDLKIFTL